jgi:hypothetical protein
MTIRIEEVDDAERLAGALFRRSFGHPIPTFPRHFVAFGRDAAGGSRVAGYVHYTAFDTTVWLCGGLCADRDAYARATPDDAAQWKRAGGIGEMILRATFPLLVDRPAVFSTCGDPKQWQHDLNAGFEPAGPPNLLVHWTRPLPDAERRRLIEQVAALPPF